MSKSKRPYQDKSKATKNNPKGFDYDGDGYVDAYDDRLAVQDANRDGKVTNSEKEAYRKKQGTTTQTITEKDGKTTVQTSQETTTLGTPQPWLDELTKEFLKKHPAVAEALRLARKNGWNQDQFNRHIENKTEFGKSRTDAQAAFDLAIAGSKSEDIKETVRLKQEEIVDLLKEAFGDDYDYNPQEVARFARTVVRDGLPESAVRVWVAGKFKPVTPGDDAAGVGTPGAVLEGSSFNLDKALRDYARAYGLPINDDFINQKVAEGLKAANPAEWLAGQRGVFQQQAKTLYPSVADLLDSSDLETIMTPYRNAAFDLLGIPPAQQNLTDPMWNKALKGSQVGGPMSLDDWVATLKSDDRYGYGKTAQGRAEFSSVAQELLEAFGVG